MYDQLKSVAKSDTRISVYHASLSDETKEHVYKFSHVGSELRCVVSTVTFGMVRVRQTTYLPRLTFDINLLGS